MQKETTKLFIGNMHLRLGMNGRSRERQDNVEWTVAVTIFYCVVTISITFCEVI